MQRLLHAEHHGSPRQPEQEVRNHRRRGSGALVADASQRHHAVSPPALDVATAGTGGSSSGSVVHPCPAMPGSRSGAALAGPTSRQGDHLHQGSHRVLRPLDEDAQDRSLMGSHRQTLSISWNIDQLYIRIRRADDEARNHGTGTGDSGDGVFLAVTEHGPLGLVRARAPTAGSATGPAQCRTRRRSWHPGWGRPRSCRSRGR